MPRKRPLHASLVRKKRRDAIPTTCSAFSPHKSALQLVQRKVKKLITTSEIPQQKSRIPRRKHFKLLWVRTKHSSFRSHLVAAVDELVLSKGTKCSSYDINDCLACANVTQNLAATLRAQMYMCETPAVRNAGSVLTSSN